MIAPTRLPDGSIQNYGFGLQMRDVRGRRSIGHGGGIPGFVTESLYLPEQDIFVAVFTNSNVPPVPPPVAVSRLAAMALGDPYPTFTRVPVDAAAIEPFLGVYALPDGVGERRFYLRDGKLYVRQGRWPEQEVFAAGNGLYFFGPDNLTWFSAIPGPDGVVVMDMHPNGVTTAERSRRTGPIPPAPPPVAVPRETLALYVGRYAVDGRVLTIAFGPDGGLTSHMGQIGPVRLRAISQTEFEEEGYPSSIVFQVEAGAVNRVVIHQEGREIPLTRMVAEEATRN
jgi:hypothetical protein